MGIFLLWKLFTQLLQRIQMASLYPPDPFLFLYFLHQFESNFFFNFIFLLQTSKASLLEFRTITWKTMCLKVHGPYNAYIWVMQHLLFPSMDKDIIHVYTSFLHCMLTLTYLSEQQIFHNREKRNHNFP